MKGSSFSISHFFTDVLDYYQWTPALQHRDIAWFVQLHQKEENVEVVLFGKPLEHADMFVSYREVTVDVRLILGAGVLFPQRKITLSTTEGASYFERTLYRRPVETFLSDVQVIKNRGIHLNVYFSNISVRSFTLEKVRHFEPGWKKNRTTSMSIEHAFEKNRRVFQFSPMFNSNEFIWFLSMQFIDEDITIVLTVTPVKEFDKPGVYWEFMAQSRMLIGAVEVFSFEGISFRGRTSYNRFFYEKQLLRESNKEFYKKFELSEKKEIPIHLMLQNMETTEFRSEEIYGESTTNTTDSTSFCHKFDDMLKNDLCSSHACGNIEWILTSRPTRTSIEISLQVRKTDQICVKAAKVTAEVTIIVDEPNFFAMENKTFCEILDEDGTGETVMTIPKDKLFGSLCLDDHPGIEVHVSKIKIEEPKLVFTHDWSSPTRGSDIILLVEGTQFHCHTQVALGDITFSKRLVRKILTTQSRTFERILEKDGIRNDTIEIRLEGVSVEAFQDFLHQMYYLTEPLRYDNMLNLLHFGRKFENDQILFLCQSFLSNCLEHGDADFSKIEIFLLCWHYNLQPLKTKCLHHVFYSENPPKIKHLLLNPYYQSMEESHKSELMEYLFSEPLRKFP